MKPENIGKDVTLCFNNELKQKITIGWRDWLKYNWDYIEVGGDHRKNPLSNISGRFIVFTGQYNIPRYKCYINVHDWKFYIRGIINKGGGGSVLLDFDFIVIWDNLKNEKIDALIKQDNETILIKEELRDFLMNK